MLSGVQPCFQLLRIGSSGPDSARDLYTFRPALSHSVFRLGRAAELCDVTLDSAAVSRIHAELRAKRDSGRGGAGGGVAVGAQEDGWMVHVKDRSSHGTWVNEVRLQPGVQWELCDGDTLNFGGASAAGSSEFYFLFQKVKVRPLDFDAITIPKAGTFSSDLQNRIRTSLDQRGVEGVSQLRRATVILSSIGSLSKVQGSAWTFRRSASLDGSAPSVRGSASSPPLAVSFSSLLPPSTPPPFPSAGPPALARSLPPSSRSRRKSAHTVLLEDDNSDEPRHRALGGAPDPGSRSRSRKRRRLYKSESEGWTPPAAPPVPPKAKFEAKPFPAGTRTIGSYHGAVTNSKLLHPNQFQNHQFQTQFQTQFPNRRPASLAVHRASESHRTVVRVAAAPHGAFRQQKMKMVASRGRRQGLSSPVYSPLVVGGENYNLASPSVRLCAEERGGRLQINRFHHLPPGKRRGRPRKHPLPPRPSLPSPPPSSSSSSSSSSGSSSSSSSSSCSEDDEDEEGGEGATGAVEPCAAPRCRLPQQDTVQWIQCDVCDAWFHVDCLRGDRRKMPLDPNADFHCGCR